MESQGWQGCGEEGRKERQEGRHLQAVCYRVETLSLHFISGASEVMSSYYSLVGLGDSSWRTHLAFNGYSDSQTRHGCTEEKKK